MTDAQFNEFLAAVVFICVAGIALNLGKLKTRGRSAQLMACSFASLAIGVFFIRLGANRIFLGISGAVTFGLLAADAVYRIKNPPGRQSR